MVSDWASASAVYQKHEPPATSKGCSLPESAGANGSYLSLQRILSGYYCSRIKVIYRRKLVLPTDFFPCAWTKFRFAYGTAIAYILGCLEPILLSCLAVWFLLRRDIVHRHNCECDQITKAQLYLKRLPPVPGRSLRSQ
jgi:hypothetical protein